jgi:hypothetical protein
MLIYRIKGTNWNPYVLKKGVFVDYSGHRTNGD